MQHSLSVDDGIQEGSIYTFRWYAINSVGESQASKELTVAAIDDFPAPENLSKVVASSTLTSIYVQWDPVTEGVLPGGEILGYLLQVEDTNNGTTWTAFDGQAYGLPQ